MLQLELLHAILTEMSWSCIVVVLKGVHDNVSQCGMNWYKKLFVEETNLKYAVFQVSYTFIQYATAVKIKVWISNLVQKTLFLNNYHKVLSK